MYLYQNKMIRGAWTDADGTWYPAGHINGLTPEQLAEIGVQVVPDIPMPEHNAETHRAEQLEDGDWMLIEVATLQDLIARKCANLEAAYQSAIGADISYTSVGGVTKLFQADEASVASLSKSLLGCEAAGETPAGFFWKATDNTRVPFTYADLRGLASAMFQRGAYWFAHLSDKKDAANSAQSVSELNQVNW